MSSYLYSADTTPAAAASLSADRSEIIHVHCSNVAERKSYADALIVLLTDSAVYGGGNAELEVVGDLHGSPVRVHLATP